jgi:peptide/nickel transport system permease protein
MRFTDIVMGVPFLPFVIVMLSVFGKDLGSLMLAMTLIMWRASARIVRAQVMSLKQMPFVAAARITGASDLAILYREIAPNIVPLAMVNMAFALALGDHDRGQHRFPGIWRSGCDQLGVDHL